MSKKKNYKIQLPQGIESNLNISIPANAYITRRECPVIGLTYCDILDKNYGFKNLHNAAKKRTDIDFYSELKKFLDYASKSNSITEFISMFQSHNSGKNSDKISKQKVSELQENYGIEVGNLIHLHCKAGGKGSFVLHGFVLRNVFEIVWFDPEHKLHKT